MFKLKITLTEPKTPSIGYNNQYKLVGAFHKWMGDNQVHDKLSFYSFSNLSGFYGKKGKRGLFLKDNQLPYFYISAFEDTFLERLLNGIKQDENLFDGMKVKTIEKLPLPGKISSFFIAASPVFVRFYEKHKNHIIHLVYDNHPRVNSVLTDAFRQKLTILGIHNDAKVSFVWENNLLKPKTKLVSLKKEKYRASLCSVKVEGSLLVQQIAWVLGVGKLNGLGFGHLLLPEEFSNQIM